MTKISRHDGKDLRRILIGMITDSAVCARISSQWRPEGLFDSPWANLVGSWCVAHMAQYSQPVGMSIQSVFDSWSRKASDNDKTVEAVGSFLVHLSDEYDPKDKQNSEYLIDLAGTYFNRVKIKRTIEAASDDLERNEVAEAQERLANVGRVELGTGAMVRPAEDFSIWQGVFNDNRSRGLIPYPGYLNDFLGQWMERESLIAFMAPDKSGKSVWIWDAAFRALKNHCKVAYFDMGDMGQKKVLRRLGQRAARQSLTKKKLKIPVSIDVDGEVAYKIRESEKLTERLAFKALRRACGGSDRFRLVCYPTSSMDVTGLAGVLRDWQREGWLADCVIIDYADIMGPHPGFTDKLDQIDADWDWLHRIAQEFHCLVITGTQSNAAAYGRKGLLKRKHFSGRKTKLALVDGMIGINVSDEDKGNGIARLNWVVAREGGYSENKFVWVAGCYDIYNPSMRSAR